MASAGAYAQNGNEHAQLRVKTIKGNQGVLNKANDSGPAALSPPRAAVGSVGAGAHLGGPAAQAERGTGSRRSHGAWPWNQK